MDFTAFGYHVLMEWNSLGITGPDLDIHLNLFTVVFILLPILLFFKKRGTKRKATDDDSSLVFGEPGAEGKCASYGDAEDALDRFRKKDTVVAVIDVSGIILDEKRGRLGKLASIVGDEATFGLELGNMLKTISSHEKLAAVFVRVSTPGGTIPGSQYIFDGLRACVDAGKPVYCYVQDMSASGGVWMMVGASQIIAHPNSILGSIGVIGPSLKHFKGVTQIGEFVGQQVHAQEITSRTLFAGKGKNFGDPFGEVNEEAEQSFRSLLDEAYELFLAHVARCRSITSEKLREMGAVLLSAPKAQQTGLIDAIGDQGFAQNALAKELGVAWEDCKILRLRFSGKRGFSLALSQTLQSFIPATAVSMRNLIRAELGEHLVLVLAKFW